MNVLSTLQTFGILTLQVASADVRPGEDDAEDATLEMSYTVAMMLPPHPQQVPWLINQVHRDSPDQSSRQTECIGI